jgi:hypothetical protein
VVLFLSALGAADELSANAIVKTIRFHPTGEPARVGMSVLSRIGERGWRALSALTAQYKSDEPQVALAAATALAEGPESERLAIVASTYNKVRVPELRAVLAVGLAYGYEEHRALLLKHMRENRLGAIDVLRVLAPRALSQQELRSFLKIPVLAPVAYAALRERRLIVKPEELVPWAREIGRACLDRDVCDEWSKRGDFTIYDAVAMVVGDKKDEDARDGAHCLLLTLSGKKLYADPLVWRSWILAHRDKYEPPPPQSKGRIAAAVVRAARYLRVDLLADGRCNWAPDTGHLYDAGSTSLAVLALLAAEYPKSHPAIKKALATTMVVEGSRGAALPAFPERGRETYNLSLLAMALAELDAKRYRVPLQALHKRILVGMHKNGTWGYTLPRPTDSVKHTRSDNSCTQYAVLALRALDRAGFKTKKEIWRTIAKTLHATVNGHGGWNYHPGSGGYQLGMTAAGMSSLAIAHEGINRREAAGFIQLDRAMLGARAYMGRMLMEGNYWNSDLYTYYGVERAMVLTATKGFRSDNRTYDWYARGAQNLLERQDRAGFWGFREMRIMAGSSYGRGIDTSYAILFLTKATRTVGGKKPAMLRVKLDKKHDKPDPVPQIPKPQPKPPPPPPELHVAYDVVTTRDGAAEIRGIVPTPEATLALDGNVVQLDARGRFALPVTITGRRTFRLVARAKSGTTASRAVTVEFDRELPRVVLLGPPQRHVGKQVVNFRASEPLRSLQVAGRIYPADSATVRAAIDVPEGKRTLLVIAIDRAGNESRNQVELDAIQRVLVLDGISAVGTQLRWHPEHFTLETWVRGEEPKRQMAIMANTENSGFGLFWFSRNNPRPWALIRAGKGWVGINPKKAWNWSSWTHLALCFDGKEMRYYVGGKLQGKEPAARVWPGTRRFYIGGQPNGHNSPVEIFRGAVDEVRLSTVARYTKDFRPQRTFMRDRHTMLLMHFDRATVAEGVLLDDSGTHHHMVPHAAPEQVAERRP